LFNKWMIGEATGERGPFMSDMRRRPRVFVVDDEQVIASTLAMILRKNGFDAISFTEPLEALEAAGLEAPDLLISDVVMPGLSGIDLAVQLQERCQNCNVLLFSGQAATAGMLETARANGHNFELLLKPVHPADLLREIDKVTRDSPTI
jgi:DNA-binding NtrC family response regulator